LTCIVASLEAMACDTYHDDGSYSTKIIRLDNKLYGLSGDAWYSAVMTNWIADGMRGPPPDDPGADEDKAPSHENVVILILSRNGLSMMSGLGVEMPLNNPFFSVGGGKEFALGSLERSSQFGEITPDELLISVAVAAKYAEGVKLPAEIHYLHHKRKRNVS
jgi:hypothetical protein